MEILIVDDNANNRMVLKLLLQDYCEEKNEVYQIQECENGLEAVNKSKKENFDIIFMDIIMPEMDGIEATKKIRAHNKEVMIIAVSAVDDETRQKEILRNGAEDYVAKPIDSKLLNSRLDNYFALLKLRHQNNMSCNRKAANLYSSEIFKRQTIFYVNDEEALAEFWEYYLLREVVYKIDGLSDVVRAIFSLGEAILSLQGKPWIIVEGDNEAIYFTINRLEVIGEELVKLIMKKNAEFSDFICDSEKLSFKLNNLMTPTQEVHVIEPELKLVEKEDAVSIAPVIEIEKTDVEAYKIFNYMDPDDLDEIEEQLGDLSSLMLMLGSSEIEPSEVTQISHYLDRVGRGLSIYSESYAIGQALISLGMEISSHSDRFQEIAADLSSLSSAFVSDLQSWLQMTFYKGAPSVNFMDDTIVANSQTICAMLNVDDVAMEEENIDDIFDF